MRVRARDMRVKNHFLAMEGGRRSEKNPSLFDFFARGAYQRSGVQKFFFTFSFS